MTSFCYNCCSARGSQLNLSPAFFYCPCLPQVSLPAPGCPCLPQVELVSCFLSLPAPGYRPRAAECLLWVRLLGCRVWATRVRLLGCRVWATRVRLLGCSPCPCRMNSHCRIQPVLVVYEFIYEQSLLDTNSTKPGPASLPAALAVSQSAQNWTCSLFTVLCG